MAKTREKFELINDILPAIAAKSAAILDRPVPDLSGSITRIMNAIIAEEESVWNKETKQIDVKIIFYNYSSRARQYTLLVNWPEKSGAIMVGNERGGRKETTGIWAWKMETLNPGENAVIEYSLDGLEKGDWTETEVFFRGNQEVIGATKMDEKILEEIRKQEEISKAAGVEIPSDDISAETDEDETAETLQIVEGDNRQTTLFGGEA